MEIKIQGWSRDQGPRVIINKELKSLLGNKIADISYREIHESLKAD